jgi:hypothetical protein
MGQRWEEGREVGRQVDHIEKGWQANPQGAKEGGREGTRQAKL